MPLHPRTRTFKSSNHLKRLHDVDPKAQGPEYVGKGFCAPGGFLPVPVLVAGGGSAPREGRRFPEWHSRVEGPLV